MVPSHTRTVHTETRERRRSSKPTKQQRRQRLMTLVLRTLKVAERQRATERLQLKTEKLTVARRRRKVQTVLKSGRIVWQRGPRVPKKMAMALVMPRRQETMTQKRLRIPQCFIRTMVITQNRKKNLRAAQSRSLEEPPCASSTKSC